MKRQHLQVPTNFKLFQFSRPFKQARPLILLILISTLFLDPRPSQHSRNPHHNPNPQKRKLSPKRNPPEKRKQKTDPLQKKRHHRLRAHPAAFPGRGTGVDELGEIGAVADFAKIVDCVVTVGLAAKVGVLGGDDGSEGVHEGEDGEGEEYCPHQEGLRERAVASDLVEIHPAGSDLR
jgi:hypothetical protein